MGRNRKITSNERGEGELHFIAMVFGIAIAVSAWVLIDGWIQGVKQGRMDRARGTAAAQYLDPHSGEGFGAYEVTY